MPEELTHDGRIKTHGLPHLKGVKLFIIGMSPEEGCWHIVNCNVSGCPNQATYWSKNSKKQDRSYTCEEHK